MPKSKQKYLFVGLGTMGYPMAGHLSKNNDIDLYIFNRTNSVSVKWSNQFKGLKFKLTDTSNIKFDGLITCLKDDEAIIKVLITNKLIKLLKKNSFIIDHSSTSIELINTISSHNYITKNKISFFDAPVSGGEVGAINGTLSIMFGGPNKKISKINKLMSSYSSSIVKIGPSGHGQLTKMVNQLCIAGLLQGLSEGIALGKSSNLNMNKVFEAISGGSAQSWQMDNRFKTMVDGKFDFGFAVDLMIKDLKIALNQAGLENLDLRTSNSVIKNYKELSKEGLGNLDTSSLIKLLEK